MSRPAPTGIIFFPAFDWAISPSHPEREERLLYTQDQLLEEGVFDLDTVHEYRPQMATREDIHRTHFCFPDIDSVITDSHLIAAGGAITIGELLMQGTIKNGFAMVRPPGHHAMKSVHGNRGFCNINNEAVMIEYMREHWGVKRFAIVDTDCHHGDGTQDIYWYDPDVLYISLHQDGRTLFPGSGFVEEAGGGRGTGKTINIPLPPNTADQGFLYTVEQVVLPILEDFEPDIIINSAGQDNHYTDPITNMRFSAQGYARMNDMLQPDICVLEGGYSIQGALPYVNLGIVLALAGEDYSYVHEPDYNPRNLRDTPRTMEVVKEVCDQAQNMYFRHKSSGRTSVRDSGGTPTNRDTSTSTRSKRVFYDTAGIQEQQQDTIRLCDSCSGYRLIESTSTRNPLSAGIEIPIDSCDRCYQEATRLIKEMRASGDYTTICVINRRDKTYYYV